MLAALAAVPAHAQDRDRGESRKAARVAPYIEVNQVFAAELSPGDDTVTYTQVAAGVDASIQGRHNGGSASVRYERTFGYDSKVSDSSTLSGLARGYATVIPQALTVEAGALATRTQVDGNGGGSAVSPYRGPSESRIYSAYAGPTVHTSAGEAEINANYRIGYTRAEAPDAIVSAPGAAPVDVFDESVVQSANVHVGLRPGAPLPVGIGVGGGIYQEDASNLDSRVRDLHWRGDVTVPVGPSLALVGGVGYEDVEISNRDAVRDTAGNPVIGDDGRFVTDKSSPRQLAYDVSGLIWDVGVMWRPIAPHRGRGARRQAIRFDDILRQLRLGARRPDFGQPLGLRRDHRLRRPAHERARRAADRFRRDPQSGDRRPAGLRQQRRGRQLPYRRARLGPLGGVPRTRRPAERFQADRTDDRRLRRGLRPAQVHRRARHRARRGERRRRRELLDRQLPLGAARPARQLHRQLAHPVDQERVRRGGRRHHSRRRRSLSAVP